MESQMSPPGGLVYPVVVVGDIDFTPCEDVIADFYMMVAADMDEFTNIHVVADDEVRLKYLFPVFVFILGDALQPATAPHCEMFPDMHILHATGAQVRFHIQIPPAEFPPAEKHAANTSKIKDGGAEQPIPLQPLQAVSQLRTERPLGQLCFPHVLSHLCIKYRNISLPGKKLLPPRRHSNDIIILS